MIKRLTSLLCMFLVSLSAFAGQVTGTIQTAGGQGIANASISFTLSQAAVKSDGTGTLGTTPVSCYTDGFGAAVGLPNPQVTATASIGSGSLAAGNYFVVFTYYNASGETVASPELIFNVPSSSSSIVITAPVLQPANATGYKVYVSLATGTETLQSTVTGFGTSTISTLAAGSALPGSNTSQCLLAFNDTLIPSFTSYITNILSSTGDQVPGWPQAYYFAGSVPVNLATLTPTANLSAKFPTPIIAIPANHATQSISGPLNLGTFGLTAGSINAPAFTVGSLDKIIIVDGVKYSLNVAGIQAAINDAPAGGIVVIASQNVLLSGSGTELILINKSLHLDCGGWGGNPNVQGTLTVASSAGASTDVIHVKGTSPIEGVEIEHCQIVPQSGTPGRHGINIDTTSFPISKVNIHDNYIGNLGGKAIFSTNPAPLTDGFFTSWIDRNVLRNGVLLQNAGDTIQVRDNIIPGNNCGTDATFVSGAGDFVFSGNNVTTIGCGLHLGSVIASPVIDHNEFEGQVSVTGSNSAYVDIDGAVGNVILHPKITNNQIAAVASGIDGLRLNWVDGAKVEGNLFARAGSAKDIRITANAVGGTSHIGMNYYTPTNDLVTNVIADGTGTQQSVMYGPMSFAVNGGISGGIDFYRPIGFVNGIVFGPGQGATSSAGGGAFILPAIATPGNFVGTTAVQTLSNKTNLSADGTNSAPAYSYAGETGSGWFRQQPSIHGFAINGAYLHQYGAGAISYAPAICLGWAPGAPNAFSPDVQICRNAIGVLAVSPKLKIGSDTAISNAPRTLYSADLIGISMSGAAATWKQWTPTVAVTLEKVEYRLANTQANCTVQPVVRITDLVNNSDTPTTNATGGPFVASFSQSYAAGTPLLIQLVGGTCTTAPVGPIINASFRTN